MTERDELHLDTRIDRGIRDQARRQRPGRGEHPTELELLDYQEERLGGHQEEAMRRHLALCSDCADDLLELDGWDALAPADPAPFLTPTSIEAHRRALEKRTGAAPQPEASRPWFVPATRAAVLAIASLALGLLVGSTWIGGLGWGKPTPRSSMPADHPFFCDLLPDGSSLRRSGAAQEIRVPAGMRSLVVRLNVGDQTPHVDYRAEIASPAGEIVWSRRGLVRQPSGSFVLLIDGKDLDPGSYRLLLVGRTDTTETPVAAYSFSLSRFSPE